MLDVNNTALSKSNEKIGISVLLVGVPPQYFSLFSNGFEEI